MTSQQDPLANLHDIILPDAIGFWPLAPGWWIALALVSLALILAVYFAWRHRRATAYQRQAKKELDHWLANKPSDAITDTQDWAFFNRWCKRALLCHHERQALTVLSGKQWQVFLKQQTHPLPHRVIDQLGDQLYQRTDTTVTNAIAAADLYQIGLQWLKHLPAQNHSPDKVDDFSTKNTAATAQKEPNNA